MAPVIKVDSQTMLTASDSANGIIERLADPAAGGVPKATPGSPVDGVLMAGLAEDAVVSTALTTVFTGRGPRVQAATTDGVRRFHTQDGQNQQLLQQVADEATAQGPIYTV